MGLGSIQFGGLASGLDTATIIQTLVQIERRPIFQLQGQRQTNSSKISLLGTLEGLVKDLETKVQSLMGVGSSGFFSNTVSVSNEDVATANVTGNVQAGSYTIQTGVLAERDRYAFEPVPDADAELAGPVGFQIEYDGETYFTNGENLSLNEIASKINTDMGDAVTATVINVGTEQSPGYQLVIAANDTGEDYAIDFPQVVLPTGLTPVAPVSGSTIGGQISIARNATISINGLSVERSTNEFAGVIPGMSFTIREEGADVTFNVEVDAAGTQQTVQELVDSYNAVIGFLNKQSSYTQDEGPGGDLFGETVLSSVRSALSSALFDVDLATIQADTTGFSSLSLVGVELQSDGRLQLDTTKFQEKYEQDASALADLFTGDDGVLSKLSDKIDSLIEGPLDANGDPYTYGSDGARVPGVFQQRRTVLEGINGRIDDDIERLERNLEAFEDSLVLKYANLETLLAGLNAQQSYLGSIAQQQR